MVVQYEWDPEKAASNLAKHGIMFADAVVVLSDEVALTILDESGAEERFVTIGADGFGRILVVIYVWRNVETIRIISARKATRAERRLYEG